MGAPGRFVRTTQRWLDGQVTSAQASPSTQRGSVRSFATNEKSQQWLPDGHPDASDAHGAPSLLRSSTGAVGASGVGEVEDDEQPTRSAQTTVPASERSRKLMGYFHCRS